MNEPRAAADLPVSMVAGSLTNLRAAALSLLATAALVLLAGVFLHPSQAAFSYLVAVLFLVSLAVGALFWILLHYLSAAVWSVVLRRLTEHLASLILPSAILFVPIVFGMETLYLWSESGAALDAHVAGKQAYLNTPFFVIRAVIYFGVWLALAYDLRRASWRQDQARVEADLGDVRRRSGGGMLLLAVSTTFAAFDWIMSLDPHWYSNIFGVYFWSGSILASIAAVTLLALGARRLAGLHEVITVEHLHDLGKLMFGFTVFWAYIAFSQYFLIWYAAIPEETVWYARRLQGSWGVITALLVMGHFVVPFVALLPRASKRSPLVLGLVSGWLLICHALDLYWQVMPTLHPQRAVLHWLDVGACLLVMGVFGGTIAHAARLRPLVPPRDPDLVASIHFENE